MFKKLLFSVLLVFGLSGCVTMADGTSKPDHALIELSSLAAMTIMVNELDVSHEVNVMTHKRLIVLHDTLTCKVSATMPSCPPFQLHLLEAMIANTLPPEYIGLGIAGVRLIRSRAELYLDDKLSDMENMEIIKQVAASVISGMVEALGLKISMGE